MQRKLMLLGLLLAAGACTGVHQRLGMMDEQGPSEPSELGGTSSAAAENWFESFVNMVDNAETWKEVTQVLDQGNGYLEQLVPWDDDQYTPLHYAAEKGDLGVVKELIQRRGVPVDIRTGHQRTPLHLAALEGNLEIVEYLIAKNADIKSVDKEGSNALHYAALGTDGELNTAIVRYLVEQKKMDPSLCLGGQYNLLFLAIEANNMSLVRYIMENYKEMASDNSPGLTPEDYARGKRKKEMEALIEQKNKLRKASQF